MTEENDINFEESEQGPQQTASHTTDYAELIEQLKKSKFVQAVTPYFEKSITYIHTKPIQSSLIALGSGLLLGLILNRKK